MDAIQERLIIFFPCLCTAGNLAQLLVLRIVAGTDGANSRSAHAIRLKHLQALPERVHKNDGARVLRHAV